MYICGWKCGKLMPLVPKMSYVYVILRTCKCTFADGNVVG